MLALACVVCINSSGEDWVLTSAVQQSLNHHYPSTIHLATNTTSNQHEAIEARMLIDLEFYIAHLHSLLFALHDTLCGLTFPCVLCIDAWCWQIFAHLANVSPQSPQSPAPWVESRANIRWLILSCGAPLGVVITHSFKRRLNEGSWRFHNHQVESSYKRFHI